MSPLFRHLRFSLALCTVVILLPGCSYLHVLWPWKKKPPRAVAKWSQMVGTVALVNEEGSFVLVDNGSLPSASAGTVLKCGPVGPASAEVKVTAIHKPPFVIADIVKGTPKKGDPLFQ